MGRVPPAAPPALFNDESMSTITQPAPSGVVVKLQPLKLALLENCAVVNPVPAAVPAPEETDTPVVCVSQ